MTSARVDLFEVGAAGSARDHLGHSGVEIMAAFMHLIMITALNNLNLLRRPLANNTVYKPVEVLAKINSGMCPI